MSEEKNNKGYEIKSKKEENKMLTLEIEVPFEKLEAKRDASIKHLGEHVEVKGFRRGSAPANVIAKEVGEMKVLEEMAYQAIMDLMPGLVVDENIQALTQPKIAVTKIAEGNPMTFRADFVLMPEIELGDYKKIAKEVKSSDDVKVEDEEIDQYIDYIRNQRAEAEALKKKTSEDKEEREKAKDEEVKLPEFDDEFVKTLGDFKDVDDFKTQLKENMLKDKKAKASQKRRIDIIEKIIESSKIDIPSIMVDEELQRMMQQFKGDIEMAKMDYKEYLKSIGKTEEEMMKEWRGDAEKRTKMNLIIPKIALLEKIEVDEKKIEDEVKHLKQHHSDIDDENARAYVSHVLKNEEVFKFLEEIK